MSEPWANKDYVCGRKPNKESTVMYSDPEGKGGTCPVHCRKTSKHVMAKGPGKARVKEKV